MLLVPRIEAFALPILVEQSNAKAHAKYENNTPLQTRPTEKTPPKKRPF